MTLFTQPAAETVWASLSEYREVPHNFLTNTHIEPRLTHGEKYIPIMTDHLIDCLPGEDTDPDNPLRIPEPDEALLRGFAPPEPGAGFLNALQALAIAEMTPTDTDPPLGQPVRMLIAAQKLIMEFDALSDTAPIFVGHQHIRLLLEIMLCVQWLKEAKEFTDIFGQIGKITDLVDNMSVLDMNRAFKDRKDQKPEWTQERLNSWFESIKA